MLDILRTWYHIRIKIPVLSITLLQTSSKYKLRPSEKTMQKLRQTNIFSRLSRSFSLRCHPKMTKFLPLRTFSNVLEPPPSSSSSSSLRSFYAASHLSSSRTFSSSNVLDDSQAPAPIDYRSVLQEDEFHQLADSTIYQLLEKLEEYGDTVEIDGFDVDYGNEVLTLKLGNLGTYVVNKQTPNRQIWLSSPVSGPSRYDWEPSSQAWVYRRNKANLFGLLESELEQLCGKSVTLS